MLEMRTRYREKHKSVEWYKGVYYRVKIITVN
jgi:hypothetical protein